MALCKIIDICLKLQRRESHHLYFVFSRNMTPEEWFVTQHINSLLNIHLKKNFKASNPSEKKVSLLALTLLSLLCGIFIINIHLYYKDKYYFLHSAYMLPNGLDSWPTVCSRCTAVKPFIPSSPAQGQSTSGKKKKTYQRGVRQKKVFNSQAVHNKISSRTACTSTDSVLQ